MSEYKEYRKMQTIHAKQMHYDFVVETLEGIMFGHDGDYMAIGVDGERYPIAKEIFEKTYVLV